MSTVDIKLIHVTSTTHLTKCWNMNFKTAKLIAGSLSNMLLNARRRQLLSVFTSMFPVVVAIGLILVPVG